MTETLSSDMQKTMQITVVLIVSSIHGFQNCVLTAPDTTAPWGSDVSLSCNFSQCGSLGPADTVEWNFQSNGSDSPMLLIDHDIRPIRPSVRFTGNMSLGDFSILLGQPVEAGTYSCRLRLQGHIYKSSTRISTRGATRLLHPEAPSVSSGSPWQLPLCCVTVLVILVGGALVGKWAWHKKKLQQPAVQSSQNIHAPVLGNQKAPEVKDTDHYMTLQRIKPADQPTKNEDSIYITMRFNGDGPQLPVQCLQKRSGLPTEWRLDEAAAASAEVACTPHALPAASLLPPEDEVIYEKLH